MYSRAMMVSRRLEKAEKDGYEGELLDAARRELYRAQCNCSYWHGAFGGIYLPHLRNAVYNHLIAADNLLDRLVGKVDSWVDATADDYNFDARQEVRLSNSRLNCLVAPASGGHLYELDVRTICHNLLATIARRPEAYHRKVIAGANQDNGNVASIHDRVVFKQEGLDERLQYDTYQRNSLIDHFYDDHTTLEAVSRSEAEERGDFVSGVYEATLRRSPDRVQVQLSRDGMVFDQPIQISKSVTLKADDNALEIEYTIENVPQDRPLHFAVELNFSGLPSGADDRFFHNVEDERLGQLGKHLDLTDVQEIGLVDEWLGIDVRWSVDRATNLWTFPVETVSQSEGGFELVHQSVVVMPHWYIQGDENGRWQATMNLTLDTSLAEARMEAPAVLIAGT